jgi:hypothetical protein
MRLHGQKRATKSPAILRGSYMFGLVRKEIKISLHNIKKIFCYPTNFDRFFIHIFFETVWMKKRMMHEK